MANTTFVSDFKGYKILCPADPITLDERKYFDGNIIVQFQPYKVIGSRGFTEKGHLLLDSEKDKERIAFLLKHPRYQIDFKQVRVLPEQTFDNNSVVSGGSAVGVPVSNEMSAAQIAQTAIKKTSLMKDLERKLFKDVNGELVVKANIDEAELNQYKELKKELGL